jgi:hypothetical protein
LDELGANPAEVAVGYATTEQEHARQQDALAEHGRSGVGDAAPAAASMGAVGGFNRTAGRPLDAYDRKNDDGR